MVKCDQEEFCVEKISKIEIGEHLWKDKKSEIKDIPDFLKEAVFFRIPRKGCHKDVRIANGRLISKSVTRIEEALNWNPEDQFSIF